jgi:quercetin dioxygenase-like cupin family protein
MEGDAVLVMPNEKHSFLGIGRGILRVICVVPLVDGKMPGMTAGD